MSTDNITATQEEASIPPISALMYPVLVAVKKLGGSAAIAELNQSTIEAAGLTDEQLEVVFPEESSHSGRSKVLFRLGWARTCLKKIGALENSRQGVWAITEQGRDFLQKGEPKLTEAWKKATASNRGSKTETPHKEEMDEETNGDHEGAWREELLGILKKMDPNAFERLTRRLLLEAGFQNVEVLGGSGDGGLDGVGVYRVSLVSFPTYFQCKRFTGSVPPRVVRDFRGAMAGRGEKGLLVTTGVFTKSAKQEAIRDGAPLVDLVDGDELCDLLKKYDLGVQIEMVEKVTVQEGFFNKI